MRLVVLASLTVLASCLRAPILRPSRTPLASRVRPYVNFLKRNETTVLTTQPCDVDYDGCWVLCDAPSSSECSIVMSRGLARRLKIGALFAAWFALSVSYSITNKRILNRLPLPWLESTATVTVGSSIALFLWTSGLRRPPKLSRTVLLRTLFPIGTFHAIGHIAGTVGTCAGSVAFVQVVKAAGPVYACVLSTLVLHQRVSRKVWLSLVPIVVGVCLATLRELSFAWVALLGAVTSDLAMALRNVLSKRSMMRRSRTHAAAAGETAAEAKTNAGENMTPANLFGTLTCISAAVSLPMALVIEGQRLPAAWAMAAAGMPFGSIGLAGQIALAGFFFYAYNEVAMQALSNVHPVTHAIGNTLRRVVIMLVSMAVFRTKMSFLGMAGATLAIGGAYLYSLMTHHEKLAKQAKERAEAEAEAEAEADLALVEKVRSATPLKLQQQQQPSKRTHGSETVAALPQDDDDGDEGGDGGDDSAGASSRQSQH